MSNPSLGSGNPKLGFIRFSVLIYISFLLAVVLLVVLLFVSYENALHFFFGVLFALLAVSLLGKRFKLMLFIGLFLTITASLIHIFFPFFLNPQLMESCTPGTILDFKELKDYQLTIEPEDFSTGSFRVMESAFYDQHHKECTLQGIRDTILEKDVRVLIAERQIRSTSRGLLIREVRLPILNGSQQGLLSCNWVSQVIELRDFPRNSFYEARYAQNIESFPYLDTETIRWNDDCVEGEIVFAYIPSPFFLMRGMLMPLIPLSYQSQWMITLLGLIVVGVFIPITKPILLDFAKNKVKSIFEKKQRKQLMANTKKATIIVSSKGDEREVDVDEKQK